MNISLGRFADRDKDAERWLPEKTSLHPAKYEPQPAVKFRGADYGYHCDLGGHPTPLAKILLDDDGTAAQLLLSDLLHHARGVWVHLMEWAKMAGRGETVAAYNRDMLERYLPWAKADPLDALPEAP